MQPEQIIAQIFEASLTGVNDFRGAFRQHICLIGWQICDTMPCMPVSPEKMQKLQEMMLRLGVHKNDLEEKFVRGSGKGGQKVNKTNNCVYLTHVPSGIVVRCHCEREREINRYLARRTLCEELDYRLNGAPSPRQLELKRARKRGGQPRSCSITQRKMGEKDEV